MRDANAAPSGGFVATPRVVLPRGGPVGHAGPAVASVPAPVLGADIHGSSVAAGPTTPILAAAAHLPRMLKLRHFGYPACWGCVGAPSLGPPRAPSGRRRRRRRPQQAHRD